MLLWMNRYLSADFPQIPSSVSFPENITAGLGSRGEAITSLQKFVMIFLSLSYPTQTIMTWLGGKLRGCLDCRHYKLWSADGAICPTSSKPICGWCIYFSARVSSCSMLSPDYGRGSSWAGWLPTRKVSLHDSSVSSTFRFGQLDMFTCARLRQNTCESRLCAVTRPRY